MKLLILLALTIAAVSCKKLTMDIILMNIEFEQNMEVIKKEFKDVFDSIKSPEAAKLAVVDFLRPIDEETRTKILQDSARSVIVMQDSTKSQADRYDEVAVLAQNSANLWKSVANKYIENHPAVVTETTPAA